MYDDVTGSATGARIRPGLGAGDSREPGRLAVLDSPGHSRPPRQETT
jgi:hypothetical protein